MSPELSLPTMLKEKTTAVGTDYSTLLETPQTMLREVTSEVNQGSSIRLTIPRATLRDKTTELKLLEVPENPAESSSDASGEVDTSCEEPTENVAVPTGTVMKGNRRGRPARHRKSFRAATRTGGLVDASRRRSGTVVWMDNLKGFGFVSETGSIDPETGKPCEYFVHFDSIRAPNLGHRQTKDCGQTWEVFKSLKDNEAVEFLVVPEDDPKKIAKGNKFKAIDITGPNEGPVVGVPKDVVEATSNSRSSRRGSGMLVTCPAEKKQIRIMRRRSAEKAGSKRQSATPETLSAPTPEPLSAPTPAPLCAPTPAPASSVNGTTWWPVQYFFGAPGYQAIPGPPPSVRDTDSDEGYGQYYYQPGCPGYWAQQ